MRVEIKSEMKIIFIKTLNCKKKKNGDIICELGILSDCTSDIDADLLATDTLKRSGIVGLISLV